MLTNKKKLVLLIFSFLLISCNNNVVKIGDKNIQKGGEKVNIVNGKGTKDSSIGGEVLNKGMINKGTSKSNVKF